MLKLDVTKDRVYVEIENENILYNKEIKDFIGSMIGTVYKKEVKEINDIIDKGMQIIEKQNETNSDILLEKVDMLNRRLPNTFKKYMDIDKNKNYSVFRCPNCGQSIVIKVDNLYIGRDIEKNRLFILCASINDRSDDIIFGTEEVFLNVDDDIYYVCPYCFKAEESYKWIDAYYNPLKYFEYENPCPMCGSETIMEVDKDNNIVIKCDNVNCNQILGVESHDE